MPFAPGQPKPANSGRKRGAQAKRMHIGHSQFSGTVSERLRQMGCDPIEGMARLAMDEKNAPELRGRMYAELAQYEFPKRKAVEHSLAPDLTDDAASPKESLRARIAGIASRLATGSGPGGNVGRGDQAGIN